MDHENSRRRRVWSVLTVMFFDVLIVNASWAAALWIRFDFQIRHISTEYLQYALQAAPYYTALCLILFYLFGIYHFVWSLIDTSAIRRITLASAAASLLYVGGTLLFKMRMPISVYFIFAALQTLLLNLMRFSYRFFCRMLRVDERKNVAQPENVMVVGAGEAGCVLIRELKSSKFLNTDVCCIIDDNPAKKGCRIEGVLVVGGRDQIVESVRKYDITEIVIAIPGASAAVRKQLLEICQPTGCKIRIVPGIYQLVNGTATVSQLRDVQVEDLLGRDPVHVNTEEILQELRGQVVLVTGGGGSIGSELCRQVASHNPAQLVILDIYENNAYAIQQELRRTFPNLNLAVVIASVRDRDRLDMIFAQYRPSIVFHAAAHKHVPLMEDSPNEAIKNNVFGTLNTAVCADKYLVRKFILISTDKAVNPTNIMGASKRLCEMLVQTINKNSQTDFVAVRFGNVLGSNGSVVPLFKRQIAAGGPVTVTHKDITRFFMTIPEAVSLILQAEYYAKGGEIFVLDMGDPVKIDDLARNLIRLSGLVPDVDIRVEYVGLRPGEKLYEELLMNEEGLRDTANHRIHIGRPIELDEDTFWASLSALRKLCQENDPEIRAHVAAIVPTYHPIDG